MSAIFFLAPQPTLIDSFRQQVHSNAILSASGTSAVFTGLGLTSIIVTINVTGAVTGSSPNLTLIVEELDPGDLTTILQTVTATAITATLNQRTVRMTRRFGDAFRVKWTVTGTTPVFNGVYTTLTAGITSPAMGAQLSADSLPVTLATNQAPTVVGQAWFEKITDGTNTAAVKAASTPAATTDPALVVAVSPNSSIKVWDGTNVQPAGDVAARARFNKITDGTSTAAVKAASTAAAAADPALVVSLSPNSPVALAAGTQNIGDVDIASWLGGSTAPTVGQKAMSSSIPVVLASDQFESDLTASGTIGAPGDLVTLSVAGKRSVGVRIPVGSLTGTLCAQVTFDGSVWSLANFVDPTDGSYFFSFNVVAGQNPYYYIIPLIGGHTAQVRIGCLSYTSGTSGSITMRASPLPGLQLVVPYTTAAKGLFVRNTDGTNTAAVKAASTAAVAADPALVVSVSPNTPIKVWDGTNLQPAGDVAARARFNKITDGTSTAAVKAASTAPVAADPALVVSISPNIGAGISNWLGSTTPSVGQKTAAASLPVVVASDQTVLGTTQKQVATATLTSITSSATTVQILAANAARLGGYILNDSSSELTIKYGTTASTTSKTAKIAAGGSWPLDDGYTGRIDGFWAVANGFAYVTEL